MRQEFFFPSRQPMLHQQVDSATEDASLRTASHAEAPNIVASPEKKSDEAESSSEAQGY